MKVEFKWSKIFEDVNDINKEKEDGEELYFVKTKETQFGKSFE